MSEDGKVSRETEVLIRRCREGDQLAFSALLRQYQDYVYRLCFLVMRNEQDAEDMAQETLIRAMRALPRFEVRQGSSFEAWLYRIAVNRCRSRLRHKWYQVLQWTGIGPQPVAGSEAQPERLVLQLERRSEILEAINALGEKHRLVVILHYYGGLSNQEIAGVLRIPPGTVRSRLHTARQRLKNLLIDSFGQERQDTRMMSKRVAP